MNSHVWSIAVAGLLAVSVLVGGVLAASTDGFDLGWHVVAAAGGASSSEDYALQGTAGQPAVGVLSSADYALGSGFWGGGELAPSWNVVYLPLVVR